MQIKFAYWSATTINSFQTTKDDKSMRNLFLLNLEKQILNLNFYIEASIETSPTHTHIHTRTYVRGSQINEYDAMKLERFS